MKRYLALILALVMLFTCLPMTTLAQEYLIEDTPAEVTKPVEESAEPTEEATDPVEEPSAPAEPAKKNADSNITAQGTCGDDLTWTLTEDGLLTISGTGAMSYCSEEGAPWWNYRESITSVVLEEGVTTVSTAAFSTCENLTTVTLPEGLTSIGDYAFLYCCSLNGVMLPESLTSLGVGAFHECGALTEIRIPSKITTISEQAFYSCDSLVYVEIPYGVTIIGKEAFCNSGSLSGIVIQNHRRQRIL